MDQGARKIVDHMQKRNCQECGAFLINSEDEENNQEGCVDNNEGVFSFAINQK